MLSLYHPAIEINQIFWYTKIILKFLLKYTKGEKMNSDLVRENERIDDLQLGGLKLIQNPEWFCFGVDAVLLADFAKKGIKKDFEVVDFCTGNGIIPILLSAKTDAKLITGIEIQDCIADLASRNVKFNNLEQTILILNGDVKNAPLHFKKCSVDYITCNPPYKEAGSGLKNTDSVVSIARHEILLKLEDIIKSAENILKPGGKIAIIHRPERLIDIIWLLRQNKIEPKRLRFIHPYPEKTATMILIEGTKHGGKKLFLEPPLYIYDENKNYTKEIDRIYGRI